MFRKITIGLALAAAFVTTAASAGAIHDQNLFTANTLARNDDGSTGVVDMGFNINFFGANFTQLYVNNNGNVTFNHALNTYTPFSLLSTSTPMLAPFFADVDTRNSHSEVVQYAQSTIGGRNVFGVNWINVGYYQNAADKTNSFQLIITDRSDTGAGNFDFQYNYDNVHWETGTASNGTGGIGGTSARAGWSNGVDHSYELAGSAVNGALLDTGSRSLVGHSIDSGVDGRYNFSVRNGIVAPPVPEPETYAMLLAGLGLLVGVARRKSAGNAA
ncbi:hypothetical protein ACFDR9_003283 [Janthinobacterium sp. CG_23.3]|uniref:nidogen-like domain-containing protein n=1 Tax=unclassified Janthinobacterium TaxID=2610881 RepID=UPI0003492EDA|nr:MULTISPECIES: nidogen-like domain-containing protein [unclassified Janthinobacterium]MEC5159246.1 hypothetical protein [Janthinobacterium sp. CG_S6]